MISLCKLAEKMKVKIKKRFEKKGLKEIEWCRWRRSWTRRVKNSCSLRYQKSFKLLYSFSLSILFQRRLSGKQKNKVGKKYTQKNKPKTIFCRKIILLNCEWKFLPSFSALEMSFIFPFELRRGKCYIRKWELILKNTLKLWSLSKFINDKYY